MSKIIGTSSSITAQKRRETFRVEINIGGTDALPIYSLVGHAVYVTRDANGVEIGRQVNYVSMPVSDSQITGALRTGITNLVARFDTINLPGEA